MTTKQQKNGFGVNTQFVIDGFGATKQQKKKKNGVNKQFVNDGIGVKTFGINENNEIIISKKELIKNFVGNLKLLVYQEIVAEFAKRYLYYEEELVTVTANEIIIKSNKVNRKAAVDFFKKTFKMRNTYRFVNMYFDATKEIKELMEQNKEYQTKLKKKEKETNALHERIGALTLKNGILLQKLKNKGQIVGTYKTKDNKIVDILEID